MVAQFEILPVLAWCPAGPFLNNVEFGRKTAPKHRRATSRGAQMPDGRIQGNPDMATGVVKFFNAERGFGFIQPQDGGKDVFVHISAIERAGLSTLREGQKLSYDVVSDRGKQAASNLQEI
jgi:cold shock protein